MNTLNKIFDILVKNIGYTIILVAAIILFAVFSGGLLYGLITAASAIIAYVCIEKLYKEFTKTGAKKKK